MKKLFRSGFAPPLIFALAMACLALAPTPAFDVGPPTLAAYVDASIDQMAQLQLVNLDIELEALPAEISALQVRSCEVGAASARSGPGVEFHGDTHAYSKAVTDSRSPTRGSPLKT
ncbi:MAG: hypothetical protein M3547_05380 [Acidobacteriota bacterium]|nr:hypothetical protein [Acidobacteriota bacterium]